MTDLTVGKWKFNSHAEFHRFVDSLTIDEIKSLSWQAEKLKTTKRSPAQNSGIHIFCREQAGSMNDSGFTQRIFWQQAREGFEVDWSETAVKEIIWRPVQKALGFEVSTTKLEKSEVNSVYENICRGFSDKGVPVVGFARG